MTTTTSPSLKRSGFAAFARDAYHRAWMAITLLLLLGFIYLWFTGLVVELWSQTPYCDDGASYAAAGSQEAAAGLSAPGTNGAGIRSCMDPGEFSFRADLVLLFTLFLPVIGYSFYFFRRRLRLAEVERICMKLGAADSPAFSDYVHKYASANPGLDFTLAVVIAWVVAAAGLSELFIGTELGIDRWVGISGQGAERFPASGSMVVVGMAFLGAYVWGLQYLMRRHVLGDLTPDAFYVGVVRMIVAAVIAFVFYNAFNLATDLMTQSGAGAGTAAAPDANPLGRGTWAGIAFLIGVFPQRGLDWLGERFPILSATKDHPAVRRLPAEMIQGVSAYDKMRLEELGIESCYDLADADFFVLLLKSSYSARELADWILQAKLCVCCGDAVKDLREEGIRWVTDLASLDDAQIADLAQRTHATKASLERGRATARGKELTRLTALTEMLSEFTPIK